MRDDPFEPAFAWLMRDEGHVASDPQDKGGLTSYGVTLRTLGEYLGHQASEAEMRALTLKDAKALYRAMFWEPLCLDTQSLEPKVSLALFNLGVLLGRRRVVLLAQIACSVSEDGLLGPKTQAALAATKSGPFLFRLVSEAELFLSGLCEREPAQLKFLRGWLRRCHRLLGQAF